MQGLPYQFRLAVYYADVAGRRCQHCRDDECSDGKGARGEDYTPSFFIGLATCSTHHVLRRWRDFGPKMPQRL